MNKNNKMFIATGYSAARLAAENSIPRVRPGGKAISPTIDWEEAPEDMKNNPKVMWITEGPSWDRRKKTFRRFTEEEKQEMKLNQKWRIEQIFLYILNKYGWEFAECYAKEKKDIIEKTNAKVSLDIPHCEYSYSRQCDIFCRYFKGGRCIKGE